MLPPAASASQAVTGEFVWRMEDVLDVYERPYDPKRPVVCLDETTKQLVAEVRTPLPPVPARDGKPGRPARVDYEYVRRGVASLFLVCEPLRGWRHLAVRERRTKRDWAHLIKELLDVHYPDAETIVLVQDNLNTHTPAALYEAFPPAEARRLAAKLALHYTPKHGSWLGDPLGDGRDRVGRARHPMPRRPHPRSAHPHRPGHRLVHHPQRQAWSHPLALHYHRRPHQACSPLPITSSVTSH